jgi:hypothetical protein
LLLPPLLPTRASLSAAAAAAMCMFVCPQEQKPIIWASQYNKVMAEKKAAKKQKPQR